MSWDYWKFPCHPIAAEKFGIRGRNTIILYYHFKVDIKIGKGVCSICLIPCAFPACVIQLDIDWLPNCDP